MSINDEPDLLKGIQNILELTNNSDSSNTLGLHFAVLGNDVSLYNPMSFFRRLFTPQPEVPEITFILSFKHPVTLATGTSKETQLRTITCIKNPAEIERQTFRTSQVLLDAFWASETGLTQSEARRFRKILDNFKQPYRHTTLVQVLRSATGDQNPTVMISTINLDGDTIYSTNHTPQDLLWYHKKFAEAHRSKAFISLADEREKDREKDRENNE